MSEKIKWSYAVQVAGGPALAGAGVIDDLDAYTKVSALVPAGSNSHKVEVFPDPGADVRLLVIAPKSPNADLSFRAGGDPVALDGPVVLIGSGAAGLLAEKVGELEFKNATDKDAEISIFVARDATP